MKTIEANFDGIVGPTYHFGGLSYGNVASMKHGGWVSSPKKAALEGLKKMKFMMDLGLAQGIFPPQERPCSLLLKSLGYGKNYAKALKHLSECPPLLEALSSSSAMWSANAATVIPSSDSLDGKVHFSIANLLNRFHRAIESRATTYLFRFIFSDERHFTVHPPLPQGGKFGDEGAANHTRFRKNDGEKGVHLFVYGRSAFEEKDSFFYPARQAKEASESVARRGGLSSKQCVFAKQNPELINLGVFHNDVISVGHKLRLLVHEKAYENMANVLSELEKKIEDICQSKPEFMIVSEDVLPAKKAVSTYFFNSQFITLPDGRDALLAPKECETLLLDWLNIPIFFIDVRQSMRNGGGPACLRLRIELTEKELSHVHPSFLLDEKKYAELVGWVEKHYREELTFEDLADPKLLNENREALDALTKILTLGSFYPFQKEQNELAC